MDRKAVTELVCDACALRQPVAAACAACATAFGDYCCLVCRFFDDAEAHRRKRYYHCDACGICRVGGREAWVHCDACGTCLPPDHAPCIEGKLDGNCAVCFDRLFDSVKAIAVAHCGHAMHRECMDEMVRQIGGVPRCPTCCKTLVAPGPAREALWAEVARAVEETPMPEPYASRAVRVRCGDCSNAPFDAAFHVVGYRCPGCGGFNTFL